VEELIKMASISFSKYKIISDNIGDARTSILSAIDNMFAAVYEVAVLDDVQSTLDLLQPMFAAYQLADQTLRSINTFTSAVTALNNHVVRRNSSYTTVNDFLAANNADQAGKKLDPEFIDISNTLGYAVQSKYSA
jgi:predicted membrane-bound dolichyl-phosphate-mannose-protein mannosyltransferase